MWTRHAQACAPTAAGGARHFVAQLKQLAEPRAAERWLTRSSRRQRSACWTDCAGPWLAWAQGPATSPSDVRICSGQSVAAEARSQVGPDTVRRIVSEPQIVLTTMDLETGTCTFHRSDGKEATFETGFRRPPGSRVSRIQYSEPLRGVLITTTSGDQVALPLVTPSHPAALQGRPVIYLDQNQWSFLAQVEAGNALKNLAEDEAARLLLSAASEHRVVLPVSSGHAVESTEWRDNDRRYGLGVTLMRYSAAWQMRHPLDVEQDELLSSLHAFVGQEHDSSPAFSCDPEAWTRDQERGAFQPDEGLPEAYQASLQSLLHLSVAFDLLTDSTPIERQRSTSWREAQQAFSDELDTLDVTSAEKRQRVLAFFISDISHAIATAATTLGISPEDFDRWLTEQLPDDLPQMPYLGLRFEFLFGKHSNRGARWHDNDLIDMMFLCLAGAYADLVVCESSAASHIRQAQRRLGRTETAVSKFSAAVRALGL